MQAVLLHTEWDDRLKATSGMMRKQKQSVDMSRKKKTLYQTILNYGFIFCAASP